MHWFLLALKTALRTLWISVMIFFLHSLFCLLFLLLSFDLFGKDTFFICTSSHAQRTTKNIDLLSKLIFDTCSTIQRPAFLQNRNEILTWLNSKCKIIFMQHKKASDPSFKAFASFWYVQYFSLSHSAVYLFLPSISAQSCHSQLHKPEIWAHRQTDCS